MCGRYSLYAPPQKLKDLLAAENWPEGPPRYNAAPMQHMSVVIRHRAGMARWGFTPPWAASDDTAPAARMINARSETVADKPAFRDSWARGRRCLVPANGFYEWAAAETGGRKQPYYIHDPDNAVLAFAGLWCRHGDLVTFTILTRPADGKIARLHHRMPVMVAPSEAQAWFGGDEREVQAIIDRATARPLAYHAVDRRVGAVANDDEELIMPVIKDEPTDLFTAPPSAA